MSSTHGAVLWQLNETISHQIQFLLVSYLEQEKCTVKCGERGKTGKEGKKGRDNKNLIMFKPIFLSLLLRWQLSSSGTLHQTMAN